MKSIAMRSDVREVASDHARARVVETLREPNASRNAIASRCGTRRRRSLSIGA